MQTPTQIGRRGEAKDRGCARSLPFAKAACKLRFCDVCDAQLLPLPTWHAYCPQCYSGARLYVAIVAYRGVSR